MRVSQLLSKAKATEQSPKIALVSEALQLSVMWLFSDYHIYLLFYGVAEDHDATIFYGLSPLKAVNFTRKG